MMDLEICFICGVRIGRGNRSEIGSQEKMDKLVSVSNTVEHSSTIISDILSRILNETVLREESVCRICFNLLNDIDYHLKEAQEKTDEITAKFLDKEKDPLKYQPTQVVDPRKGRTEEERKRPGFGKLVTTSGGRPGGSKTNYVSRTVQTGARAWREGGESPDHQQGQEYATDKDQDPHRVPAPIGMRARSPSHIPVKGGGKGPRFFRSRGQEGSNASSSQESTQLVIPARYQSLSAAHPIPQADQPSQLRPPDRRVKGRGGCEAESELAASSADEMTVNALAEKKRRLLSRVLAPTKRGKYDTRDDDEERLTIDMEGPVEQQQQRQQEEEEDEDEEDEESQAERLRRRKERKRRRKEKERERRRRVLEQERERRHQQEEEIKRAEIVLRLSDASDVEEAKENTSPKKSKEFQTVDLVQLGDLFSSTNEKQDQPAISPVVARKSVPTPAARKQGVADFPVRRDQGPPGYILPDHNFARQADSDTTARYENITLEVQDISEDSEEEKAGHSLRQPHHHQQQQHHSPQQQNHHSQQQHHHPHQQQHNQHQPTLKPPTSQISLSAVTVKHHSQQQQPQPHHHPQQQQQVLVQRLDPELSPDRKPTGSPSIPCPHCNKLFMRGYNMRVHIDRVHNKAKPWQCQYCEKSFATTSDLKQHLSSHGMGKIHKCGDCGREFTNRDSAILHRKQHNNERTHVCHECNKGFFKSSCLARHMRSHTGEKPYSCEWCGRGFSQVATVKSHVKVCKAAATAGHAKEEPLQVSSVTLEDGQKIEVAAPRKLNIAVYV